MTDGKKYKWLMQVEKADLEKETNADEERGMMGAGLILIEPTFREHLCAH